MNLKKKLIIFLATTLSVGILGACGAKEAPKPTPSAPPGVATPTAKPNATPSAAPKADVVTTASIVNDPAAFLKAVSKDGTWIICTLKDMTIDKEIVLDGQFKYKEEITRKIALYAQDDKRNVTARYSLKAPKLTVKSENAKIQGGTFIGDIYVEAKGFSIVDGKVDGNIFFANEELKATFKLDKATVSGVQQVKK